MKLDKIASLVKSLNKSNVKVMLLKGADLLENTYEDISQRSMEDMDILVKQGDLDKARKVLRENNYRLLYSNKSNSEVYTLETEKNIFIDLHWRLVNKKSPSQRYIYSPDETIIWQRAAQFKIKHVPVYGMCPEDLLVYLCFHSLKERFLQKKWLIDIKLLLNKQENHIDWNQFIDIARNFGTDKLCGLILDYLKKFYSVKVPSCLLIKLKNKYPFYFLSELIFRSYLKLTIIPKDFLWLLAMNSKKNQFLFLKGLPLYLWKKWRGHILQKY